MNSIYNFFSLVYTSLKDQNKNNTFLLPFIFLLISVPLFLGLNNVVLGVFILISLLNYKQLQFKFSFELLVPILLFIWMGFSYFWSIDQERTLNAIPKEIVLFLIPMLFFFIKRFTENQKNYIFRSYSYFMVVLVLGFISRALIRFLISGDKRVFFYHGDYDDDYGLVPKLLNAIHMSVFVALAFFYFFQKEFKSKLDYVLSGLLFTFVLLLSSKNIIVIFIVLIIIQVLFYSKIANKMRLRNISILIVLIGFMFSFSNIKNRFVLEFYTNTDKGIGHNVSLGQQEGINNVSIADAWLKEEFHPSDYFPGTAFRVYQTRLFLEFLDEESIFWNGFGLNASLKKLQEKEKKYNLHEGYGDFNFHNQYLQNFAELGFIGFVLLLLLLFLNIKNAIQSKDFIHIAFAILMISLFLTESFLWRQRGVVFFTVLYCLFNAKSLKNQITT